MIGARFAEHPNGGLTRPVNCAETAQIVPDSEPAIVPSTVCIDSPSPAAGGVDSNRTFAARAFAVVNGKPLSVKQGATTRPGFQVSAQGPPGYGTLVISASTNLPGARSPITPTRLRPTAPGRTSTKVALSVPPKAKLGTYRLTVAASSAGQTRTGSRRFTVTDGRAPAMALRIARRLDRRGRLAVKVTCPAAELNDCAGSLVATSRAKFPVGGRGKTKVLALGKASFKLTQSKRKTLWLKARRDAREALRIAGKLKAVIEITARDKAGNSATRSVNYIARTR